MKLIIDNIFWRYGMNAIRHIGCSLIFAIGMCVFAGSAMALDLGGMVQQMEQAAKQMDHQAAQQPNQQQAVQQQSFAPSFNCAKASTGTEQLICSNSDLSALDVKLSQLYQQVMSKSNAVDSLKKSQNEWRKTKRDACSNVNCLASTYNERVNDLSQMLSSSNEQAQSPSHSTDDKQNQTIQQQALQQPIQQQPTTTIPPPGVALADMKFSEQPTTAQPINSNAPNPTDIQIEAPDKQNLELEMQKIAADKAAFALAAEAMKQSANLAQQVNSTASALTKASDAIDAVKVPIAFTYYIECLILILVGMLVALYGVKKFSLTIALSFAITILAFLGMVGWLGVTITVVVAVISVIIFFLVKPLSYFLIWLFGTVFVALPFEMAYQHFTTGFSKGIVLASMIAVLVAVFVFRKHVKPSLIGILSGWNVGLGLAGLVSSQLFASGHWLDALMLPGAMIFAGVVAGILFQYLYILKKRPEPDILHKIQPEPVDAN